MSTENNIACPLCSGHLVQSGAYLTCTTVTKEGVAFDEVCPHREIRASFEVPEPRLADLTDRFAAMAKRAAKLGASAPVLTIGECVRTTWHDRVKGEPRRVVPVFAVTVSGVVPRLAGWTLVAKLHHIEGEDGAATLVMGRGEPVAEQYRDAKPWCDHCRTLRRRNDTFVLRHDDGRWTQIGRSCLADFMPASAIESVVAAHEWLADAMAAAEEASEWEEPTGGSFRGPWPLRDFMGYVALVVREGKGYVSKASAERSGKDHSTAREAEMAMFPGPFAKRVCPTDADRAMGETVIAWAREIDADSDYTHNLRTIAHAGIVTAKLFGLAASMFIARDTSIMRAREAAIVSEHFGTVGKRGDFVLTVERVIPIESDYGTSYLHIMRDAAGNVAKWKASSGALESGTAYAVKGTVKAHGEYNGRKQTELTRCKAVEIEEAVAA